MAKGRKTAKQIAASKRNIKIAQTAAKRGVKKKKISSMEARKRGFHNTATKRAKKEEKETSTYLKKLNKRGTIHYKKPKRVSFKFDMPKKEDYIRAGVKPPKGAR